METSHKRPTVEEAGKRVAESLDLFGLWAGEVKPEASRLVLDALDDYVDAKIRRYLHQSGHGA